jgi:hypothetical protein
LVTSQFKSNCDPKQVLINSMLKDQHHEKDSVRTYRFRRRLSGTAAYAQTNTQDAAGTGYIGAGVVGSRYDFDTAGAGAAAATTTAAPKLVAKSTVATTSTAPGQWKPATPTSASAATTTPRRQPVA